MTLVSYRYANAYLASLVIDELHCRHLWRSPSSRGTPRQIAEVHCLAVADAEVTAVIQLSGLGVARPVQLHDGHVELRERETERERERERRRVSASERKRERASERERIVAQSGSHVRSS